MGLLVVDVVGNAAAGGYDVAVDGDGFGRSEEGDDIGDVAGVDPATHQVVDHPFFGLFRADALALGAGGDHVGGFFSARQAGVDDGHVDAFGTQLVGQILGHGHDCDVADAADGGTGAAGGQAADIDDATPAALNPVGCGFTSAAQVAHYFDVHV